MAPSSTLYVLFVRLLSLSYPAFPIHRRVCFSLFLFFAMVLVAESAVITFAGKAGDRSLDTAWRNGALLNSTLRTLKPGDELIFPQNTTFYLMGGIMASNLRNNVLQGDVDEAGICGHVALGEGDIWPAQTAGVRSADKDTIGLLGGSDPNGPLLRSLHDDVLIEDVLDESRPAELDVDPFVGMVHVGVPEGHIAHRRSSDGSDGQAEAAGGDALK